MSRRGCKRVSFSPDTEANDEPIYSTRNSLNSSGHGRRKVVVGLFSFGVSSSPAARRLLQRIGAKVGKTFRSLSFGRKNTNTKTTPSSSRKVSSSSSLSCSSSYSSSSISLNKSKSLNESESHRAQAIEDCIQFLNSSSSLSRSNSISTWSC